MNTTSTLSDRLESLTPRLKKYASRHATPTMTASDLLQIASEEILSHCSPTDNDTYMLRLADWRMRNAAKKERTYSIHVEEMATEEGEDDEMIIVDYTDMPEERLIQRETANRIQAIVRTLKPEHVTILQMLGEENLSQHEIARRLNTSQARIRYHILKIRTAFEQAGLSPSFA